MHSCPFCKRGGYRAEYRGPLSAAEQQKLQVNDARAASYGIQDYMFATSQLAQTTLRSEIGKIELDRTFEERETINSQVVHAVDRAAEPWGVKILRYEIKDIVPPASVKDALEKQMRAERERRAVVASSEGERQARINVSEGERQEAINLSEAEKLRQINEAEGRAVEGRRRWSLPATARIRIKPVRNEQKLRKRNETKERRQQEANSLVSVLWC